MQTSNSFRCRSPPALRPTLASDSTGSLSSYLLTRARASYGYWMTCREANKTSLLPINVKSRVPCIIPSCLCGPTLITESERIASDGRSTYACQHRVNNIGSLSHLVDPHSASLLFPYTHIVW